MSGDIERWMVVAARELGWQPESIDVAQGFWKRLRGLTGYVPTPAPGEAAAAAGGHDGKQGVAVSASAPGEVAVAAGRHNGEQSGAVPASAPGEAAADAGGHSGKQGGDASSELRTLPIMVFPDCRSVHTWGMRCPLDIAFVDRDGHVLARYDAVPPGKMLLCHDAYSVLERPTVAEGQERGGDVGLARAR